MSDRTPTGVILLCFFALVSYALPSHAEGALSRLLTALGITVNPGQVKTPGDAYASGDIILAQPGQGAPQQLTSEGGYRSPVFGRKGEILALKGDALVSIPVAGGAARELRAIEGAHKLLGVKKDNANEIVALVEQDGLIALATLARAGNKIKRYAHDPASPQDAALLAALQEDARDYGPVKLYLKSESKQGPTGRTIEWTDVYLKRGDASPQNVSHCDGSNCLQPALSSDNEMVVFVRSYN